MQNELNKVFVAVYSGIYLTKVKNEEILVNDIGIKGENRKWRKPKGEQ